jgi:hypothetical protein
VLDALYQVVLPKELGKNLRDKFRMAPLKIRNDNGFENVMKCGIELKDVMPDLARKEHLVWYSNLS